MPQPTPQYEHEVRVSVPCPSVSLIGYPAPSGNTPEAIAGLPGAVPGLRRVQILPGAGHWLQQERPQQVNDALVDFLASLD